MTMKGMKTVTDYQDVRLVVSGSLLGQFLCRVAAHAFAKPLSGRDDGEAKVVLQ